MRICGMSKIFRWFAKAFLVFRVQHFRSNLHLAHETFKWLFCNVVAWQHGQVLPNKVGPAKNEF